MDDHGGASGPDAAGPDTDSSAEGGSETGSAETGETETAAGTSETGAPAGTSGRAQRVEAALRFVREVLTLENVDAIEDLFAHPNEWADEDLQLPGGFRVETYEDFKRFFRRELSKIDDRSVEVDSVVAEGDEVMVRWHGTGRVTEEYMGSVPSAAEPHETTAVAYFRFRDGDIVEQRDHVTLLDLMPDLTRAGRQGVVKQIRDGVAVVDGDDRIVDVNPALVETFGRERDALLDESVAVLLGEDVTVPTDDETVVVSGPADRRSFEVQASPLTDGGRQIGRTLLFHDVTERRRRVQQLEVLTRVLRHDLRNDLTAVRGALDAGRERTDGDLSAMLDTAFEATDSLLETAETARDVHATLDDGSVRTLDLAAALARVAEWADETYPAATVDTALADGVTVRASSAIEPACRELVENACEHAGEAPTVGIDLDRDGDDAVLTVTDDGPGLPAHEREVIAAGEETPLDHGSGLGLWFAHWALEVSGGDLAFDVDDGTTVRATVSLAGEAS